MNAEFAKDFINAQSEILTLPKEKNWIYIQILILL